jgi:hypothetical protein
VCCQGWGKGGTTLRKNLEEKPKRAASPIKLSLHQRDVNEHPIQRRVGPRSQKLLETPLNLIFDFRKTLIGCLEVRGRRCIRQILRAYPNAAVIHPRQPTKSSGEVQNSSPKEQSRFHYSQAPFYTAIG